MKANRGKPIEQYYKIRKDTISKELNEQTDYELKEVYKEAVHKIQKKVQYSKQWWKKIKQLSGLDSKKEHAGVLRFENEEASGPEEQANLHMKYQRQVFSEGDAKSQEALKKQNSSLTTDYINQENAKIEDDNDLFFKIDGKFDDSVLEPNVDFEPLTVAELRATLQHTDGRKAPGADDIHAQCYKWMPDCLLEEVAELLNACIQYKHQPSNWKEAIIILIPKEGKDLSNPSGYRPISLLLTIAKLLEKAMARRLYKAMESEKREDGTDILPEIQSGFRAGKQTNDHLFRLKSYMARNSQRPGNAWSVALIALVPQNKD